MSIYAELKGLAHKIRCQRNYVLKPNGIPFVMERNPMFKNVSEANAKSLKINIWRPKVDIYGMKIQNFKDYFQPEISASLARETIYQFDNPICNKCRRCLHR